MPLAVRFAPFALAAALCHCGGSAALTAAEQGRIAGLSALIEAEVKRGSMSEYGAAAVALAIARGEVDRARGPEGGARIRELSSCARHVDEALEKRGEGGDAAAAAAVLVRVEAGLVFDKDDFIPWAQAAPGELGVDFRVVGARVLVRPAQGNLRRKLFVDGDQRVRMAALDAATIAHDPTDTEALLEAARLDPYPSARLQAIRAAGAIGGERVVLGLKDLWALADEASREAITLAWSAPRAINEGGKRELSWVSDTQRGTPQITAAYVLARSPGEGAAGAASVLERVIGAGVARERVLAINLAPLTFPQIRAAIVKAASDTEDAVALAAMSRSLGAPKEQGGATPGERLALIKKLLDMARGKSPLQALMAKAALARAGARDVLPLLDRDVHSADVQTRKGAGMALVSLGELPRAAVLAGDADPRVRVPVSCAILRAAPIQPP